MEVLKVKPYLLKPYLRYWYLTNLIKLDGGFM